MSDWPKTGPNGLPYWELAPGKKKDYGFNWGTRYSGDAVAESTWTVPTGFTANSDSFDADDTLIWVTATAVTKGRRYRFTNNITTTSGRKDAQSFEILIKDT
jgi:hypothetical protein